MRATKRCRSDEAVSNFRDKNSGDQQLGSSRKPRAAKQDPRLHTHDYSNLEYRSFMSVRVVAHAEPFFQMKPPLMLSLHPDQGNATLDN